jgi:regulator of nucleoside diphosphate kinase
MSTNPNTLRKIVVTQTDLERLQRLLEQSTGAANAQHAEVLELELAEAEVAASEAIPPSVVTMNSTVVFEDEGTGETREVTLCYPQDAKGSPGRVSVLAPVGSALLGLSQGQSVQLVVPGGRTRRLRVVSVPYQPEAAGHFHL